MWDPVVQATRTIEKDTANQSVKSLVEHMVIVPNLMSAVVNLDLVGINAKMLDVQVANGVRIVQKIVHAKMEVAVNLIPENVYVLQDGKVFIVHTNVVTNSSV